MCHALPMFAYHDEMWKNTCRCHAHSIGSYCYICSLTHFTKCIGIHACVTPSSKFWYFPPNRAISGTHSALYYRSCLSHLPTFLSWGAGSPPSLLSLQVFLVADRAHAVGAGVTIETTSHSAKHWHLRLIGLLSHALTEGVRGMGEDIPETGFVEVSQYE